MRYARGEKDTCRNCDKTIGSEIWEGGVGWTPKFNSKVGDFCEVRASKYMHSPFCLFQTNQSSPFIIPYHYHLFLYIYCSNCFSFSYLVFICQFGHWLQLKNRIFFYFQQLLLFYLLLNIYPHLFLALNFSTLF